MKKCGFLLLVLGTLGFSSLGFAEGFTARVDRKNVGVNQSFDLKLELTDLQAKGEPDLSELEKSFQVLGKEQSSITNIINGAATSSLVWEITLVPIQMGQMSIPPISIATSRGELRTQPISIQVNQGMAERNSASPDRGISFVAKANKTQLYKNEPVVISFRLTSSRSLRNVQLGELNIKDAIVEPQGQPKTQSEIINGREQLILIANYVVTPLKDGVLTIPVLVIRGETPVTQVAATHKHFDSFFGDDEDPFAGMQKMMERFTQDADMFGGFGTVKPVGAASHPIKINVLPPIAGMEPWLPATSIRLSESWAGDQSKVGEPLTRTVTTETIGLAASQLPGFDDQLKSNDDFKVYSDRPETSTKLARGQIESTRKDVFTIVPQQSGEMTFPAIKVSWWDTQSHSQKVSSIPARTIHVLPGTTNLSSSTTSIGQEKMKPTEPTLSASAPTDSKSYKWLVPYGLVSIAAILFMFLIRELFLLKKEKSVHSKMMAKTTEQKAVKILGKESLEKCLTLNEIHEFLQAYSQIKWGGPANSSFSRMFLAAESKLAHFDPIKAKDLSKRMEEALYADKPVDVEELRSDLARFIFQKERNTVKGGKAEYLPELNPS